MKIKKATASTQRIAPIHNGDVTHSQDHVITLHSFSTRKTKNSIIKNGNDTLTVVVLFAIDLNE